MYTQSEIEKELIQSKTIVPGADFVAISVTADEKGNAVHSGLLIRHDDQVYFFHYNKEKVLLNEVDISLAERVFHKELSIIDRKLIRAFINHCRIIEHTAQPNYGYFYGGSFYEDGEYHSDSPFPQLMTCVGFCINVITGFLEEKKYIEHTDWEPVSEKAEQYFQDFVATFKASHTEADIENLKKDMRRIKPSELLASGYFSELPIRKTSTDTVKPSLEEILKANVG
ncbi:hypothetical protein [Pedobacter psychrodurus]|uniref:hypothetical protein n=1 Tax=Pedobacter psychrodurus TaxID=2530456 RepID=UPI0029304290|nr:hypothetical protein [Pedobacter psychrodurus]